MRPRKFTNPYWLKIIRETFLLSSEMVRVYIRPQFEICFLTALVLSTTVPHLLLAWPEVVTKEEHVSVQTETEVEDNMADELAYVHDRMGELRRGMSGADSGYIEGDKRWSSSEASNEDEEARQLAERASQQKEHRQQRGDWQQKIIDSRSYQPSESITFIDAPSTAAGMEERTSENEPTPVQSPTVTPRPTPITTPTSDVDPFTKVNTNTEELMRQKTNYEDQKRRAREERLRKEMEEAKSPQRVSPHRGEVSPRRGDLSP
ncbi:hypothetical protein BSL78_06761 [Apostichopus japonicus]|uniref:Uncharacterized protein n=1 Tax=Stichopus japonicus TaxID=307972 RepID=A0A2G8L7S2_STIJA|nr:hypothetical protein BSL78_06761 [Apostichopus japonicus]